MLTTPDISKGVITLPAGDTFSTLPKNFTRGYTESMNFTIEKELGKGWVDGSVKSLNSYDQITSVNPSPHFSRVIGKRPCFVA